MQIYRYICSRRKMKAKNRELWQIRHGCLKINVSDHQRKSKNNYEIYEVLPPFSLSPSLPRKRIKKKETEERWSEPHANNSKLQRKTIICNLTTFFLLFFKFPRDPQFECPFVFMSRRFSLAQFLQFFHFFFLLPLSFSRITVFSSSIGSVDHPSREWSTSLSVLRRYCAEERETSFFSFKWKRVVNWCRMYAAQREKKENRVSLFFFFAWTPLTPSIRITTKRELEKNKATEMARIRLYFSAAQLPN